MTTGSDQGFTIIEVMLFLAITGVMFATLLLGVGSNIFRQNYLDGVRSYKALLQDQYAEASSIKQEQDASLNECTGGAIGAATRTTPRGASDCVILGRLIQVVNGGTAVTVSSVIGKIAAIDTAMGDIEAIQASAPKISPIGKQTIDLDAGIVLKTATTPSAISTAVVMILRSPSSGLMQIFAANSMPSSNLGDLANDTYRAAIQNCMSESAGMPTQLVRVDPRLVSADAFTTQEPAAGVCES